MMSEKALTASELTEQLRHWSAYPDTAANNALFNLVFDELKWRAHRYLRKERPGHTLQTTALVNETYIKLTEQKSVVWENRSHFFAIAATMMRRILVDYARERHLVRRGGAQEDLPLEAALTITISETDVDLLALDEALARLAEKDEQMAKVVELRFFSGLDVVETAKVLGISKSTVKRDWALARSWLHRELTK